MKRLMIVVIALAIPATALAQDFQKKRVDKESLEKGEQKLPSYVREKEVRFRTPEFVLDVDVLQVEDGTVLVTLDLTQEQQDSLIRTKMARVVNSPAHAIDNTIFNGKLYRRLDLSRELQSRARTDPKFLLNQRASLRVRAVKGRRDRVVGIN